nr:MAG: internal scaffolding protein [Microvirus sp.]
MKKNTLVRPLSERTTAPLPTGKGGAKQIFAAESDINAIMKRHIASNTPLPAPSKPQYIDLTQLPQNLMDAHHLKNRLTQTINQFPPELVKLVQAYPLQTEEIVKKWLSSLPRKGKGGQGAAEHAPPPAPTPADDNEAGESSPKPPAKGK